MSSKNGGDPFQDPPNNHPENPFLDPQDRPNDQQEYQPQEHWAMIGREIWRRIMRDVVGFEAEISLIQSTAPAAGLSPGDRDRLMVLQTKIADSFIYLAWEQHSWLKQLCEERGEAGQDEMKLHAIINRLLDERHTFLEVRKKLLEERERGESE
ncbi:hypothetical protein MKZ38_007687 [Zalerion maritima]|uniref:Uncharacterized protein n=1 Tax=Zalerion maritima TaxID=339359 RepID=A0AAD5RIC5_9PEZI|nr:hypothetical protein MKZ38_007687 [Zalerion maritima]